MMSHISLPAKQPLALRVSDMGLLVLKKDPSTTPGAPVYMSNVCMSRVCLSSVCVSNVCKSLVQV